MLTSSSLTNKLLERVRNFFDSQLHFPVPLGDAKGPKSCIGLGGNDQRPMTTDKMLAWFGKVLDAVKMRFSKLQRFAW